MILNCSNENHPHTFLFYLIRKKKEISPWNSCHYIPGPVSPDYNTDSYSYVTIVIVCSFKLNFFLVVVEVSFIECTGYQFNQDFIR